MGHIVGGRVSANMGMAIPLTASDDGAPTVPGGAQRRQRKAQVKRERVFGTIVKSTSDKLWEVIWDSDNFKADSGGVRVTQEFTDMINEERDATAGTGLNSPDAQRR